MQKTSIRIHALLPAILLLLHPMQAEARRHHGHGAHCRLGQLYRVSMGKCVGARSALGREIRPMSLTFHRRLSRHAEAKPEEASGDSYYVDILLPHDRSLKGVKIVKDLDKPRDKGADSEPDIGPDDPSPIFWPNNWDKWPPKAEGDKLIHR